MTTTIRDKILDEFNATPPDIAECTYRNPQLLQVALSEDEVVGLAVYMIFRAGLRYRGTGRASAPTDELDQDERIAYHEAGHAVAALYCNDEIVKVTIAPAPDKQEEIQRAYVARYGNRAEALGKVLGYMSSQPRRVSRTKTWNNIRILLAGPVAEGIRFGWTGYCSGYGDALGIIDAAQRVTSGPKRRHEYLLRAFDQTEVLIEHRWEMVENLAKVLMDRKTLQGAESVHAMYGA